MCGILGFIDIKKTLNHLEAVNIATAMADIIKHRGPDDQGIWIDDDSGVVLAHRRLSIQDLTEAGRQPMISKSGRYVIVFNGEIYNHYSLRKDLETNQIKPWIGHSDTETLLMGFDIWGIHATVKKCNGMFAFAVWDKKTKELSLCRDRMGEKPLYYGWQNGFFLFASELKAIKKHPKFRGEIDRGALTLFMRHNYIPCPYSIFTNIRKLNPGSICTLNLDSTELQNFCYWDLKAKAIEKSHNKFEGSIIESVNELDKLLNITIKNQMIADVEVGAFLSGGIDSSLVVSILQALSPRQVNTFTIGFNSANFNEAVYAKAIANHLGTKHNELYVSDKEIRSVIPILPSIFCEPFADSSQVPTFLVSQLAKKSVSVSLSGDAGDELFCGYARYSYAEKINKFLKPFPTSVKEWFGKKIMVSDLELINEFGKFIGYKNGHSFLGDRIKKAANLLDSRDFIDLYKGIVSCIHAPSSLVIGGYEPETQFNNDNLNLANLTPIEKLMVIDLLSYLPDDNLVKLDRSTMAVSLEGRVPFLDFNVVEFALALPLDYKLHQGITKWPLRQVLKRYIPEDLFERPKMGFSMPLNDWLRGPLREWAESLLNENKLHSQGYLNSKLVNDLWRQHIKNERNWGGIIWNILMFQAWLESN
jgi:asparagine synthase (glutamine-hydrolysing)